MIVNTCVIYLKKQKNNFRLTYSGLGTHMATEIWVNIGLSNGLLHGSTKQAIKYLNHSWLAIYDVLRHLPQGTSGHRGNAQDIYPWYVFENY